MAITTAYDGVPLGEIDRYEHSLVARSSASASARTSGSGYHPGSRWLRGTTVGAVMSAPVAVMVRWGHIEMRSVPSLNQAPAKSSSR